MRRHLTYANVVASLALFIALGGASYAAIKLPKNSVGTKQIKNKAVTKAKLAKGLSVRGKTGAPGVAGPKGDTGAQGPKGDQGPAGADGTATPDAPATAVTSSVGTCAGTIGSFCSLAGIEWTNFGGGFAPATYRRDARGVVHLSGLIKSPGAGCGTGDGYVIFNLPAGDRPAGRLVFATVSNDAIGRIDVAPDGAVRCMRGNGSYVTLDGVDFLAATS